MSTQLRVHSATHIGVDHRMKRFTRNCGRCGIALLPGRKNDLCRDCCEHIAYRSIDESAPD